ncbi:GNAT family N-acetyltransferase [Acinetobacter rudis]|uniref:N-acetyltransferase domain-containing protein n=1 Tax=Acinetobacter rudis CIP 110305 TaxID=421052 RepID=S3N294_9GAMM|nr:GNAT family N-acetyltransferase [Acinetobacter rudis]EPF72653.1 hypothetical protein F945_02147 [Acinetobacter rudis CIP 110305]
MNAQSSEWVLCIMWALEHRVISKYMKKCYLTDLLLADVPSLVRVYTDPVTRKYLGGPLSGSVAELRALEDVKKLQDLPVWAIRVTESHDFVGTISLDNHHDGLDIEVSYELLPEFMGKGYATEALSLVLSYAFNEIKLQKLIAETQTKNKSSVKLLKRAGFSFERNLIRYESHQAIYSITNHLYFNREGKN